MSDFGSPYSTGTRVVMAHDHSIPAVSGLKGGVRTADGSMRLSSGPAFGANGELNASSKEELMRVISSVLHQAQTQTVRTSSVEDATVRLAQLRDAFADKSGAKFQVLGEVISDEI